MSFDVLKKTSTMHGAHFPEPVLQPRLRNKEAFMLKLPAGSLPDSLDGVGSENVLDILVTLRSLALKCSSSQDRKNMWHSCRRSSCQGILGDADLLYAPRQTSKDLSKLLGRLEIPDAAFARCLAEVLLWCGLMPIDSAANLTVGDPFVCLAQGDRSAIVEGSRIDGVDSPGRANGFSQNSCAESLAAADFKDAAALGNRGPPIDHIDAMCGLRDIGIFWLIGTVFGVIGVGRDPICR
ncbi:unnamed protein product [Clonostachys byssicola]|uniref:Uncharacterized protein n=1 Tax=Clonostachys byssicola TaxID=160290 RepID=A0A9N9Y4P9_9HYPO|nr:unnamed protein product [Clonostachys byssicola]